MFELVRDKESFIQNLMVSLNAMKEYVTILEQTAKFMGPVPAHLSLQIEQGWEHYADLKALQANQPRASPSSPGNVIQIAVHTFTGWFRVAAARELFVYLFLFFLHLLLCPHEAPEGVHGFLMFLFNSCNYFNFARPSHSSIWNIFELHMNSGSPEEKNIDSIAEKTWQMTQKQ